MSETVLKNIALLKKNLKEHATSIAVKQLEEVIEYADDQYYNQDNNVFTDGEYDQLRDIYEKRTGKKRQRPAPQPVAGKKVELPFHLGSMDKMKMGERQVEKWIRKYTGPYLVSAKLDGASALYIKEKGVHKLYTRGDGKVGQDISFLISELQLPDLGDILAVRGEIIMSKESFRAGKFTKSDGRPYENARNTVSGLVNSKATNYRKDIAQASDFVAYEIISKRERQVKPSTQMSLLEKSGLKVVPYQQYEEVSEDSLSKLFDQFLLEVEYEIDGVIVYNDQPYVRNVDGNPDYAKAFKKNLDNLVAETTVKNVIWELSRTKYIKPVLELEPVKLDGVTIKRVTAYNAKFVFDNKIGKGSKIKIIRSGGVIPKVLDIISEADEMVEPDVPYKWTETKVDILLDQSEESEETPEMKRARRQANVKRIHFFFNSLGVENFGEKTVEKIAEKVFKDPPDIIDFLELTSEELRFLGPKTSITVASNIKEGISSATLEEIMAASQLFGRGMGLRRLKVVMESIPDFWSKYGGALALVDDDVAEHLIVGAKIRKDVERLEGFSKITAQQIEDGYLNFYGFFLKIRSHLSPKTLKVGPKPLNVADLVEGSGFSGLSKLVLEKISKQVDLIDLTEELSSEMMSIDDVEAIFNELEGIDTDEIVASGLAEHLKDYFLEYLESIESDVDLLHRQLGQQQEEEEEDEEEEVDPGEQIIDDDDDGTTEDEALPVVPENIVLSDIKGKAKYDKLIKARGGSTSSSVSGKTSILVIGDDSVRTTKRTAAEKKGIPVMTLEDFLETYKLE